MAQNSVNVTQNLQAKPSIFELVAADSFQSNFYPALKRIAHVITDLYLKKNISKIRHLIQTNYNFSFWLT